jgi:prephenate dehydratase
MGKLTLAYAGEIGSFSCEAAKKLKKKNANFLPCGGIEKTILAFKNKEADMALLPVHNTINGPVKGTIKLLARLGKNIEILDSVVLKIEMVLMAKKSMPLKQIKKIATYEVALKQCTKFLKKNFKKIKIIDWPDMALAAKELSLGNKKLPENETAIIGPLSAAKLYKLKIIKRNIQDVQSSKNLTTFILIK